MRILFFGKLREALGDMRELADEPAESVATLRRRLAALHPHVAADLLSPRVRACVDDTVVGEDFVVGGHAEVALLPPLSGG
jgi:molybdopterin converting factor small subunit